MTRANGFTAEAFPAAQRATEWLGKKVEANKKFAEAFGKAAVASKKRAGKAGKKNDADSEIPYVSGRA